MQQPEFSAAERPSRWIVWLILALCGWGLLLALGSYLFTRDQWGLARAVIILACVAAFLGSWGGLLWWRARRRRLAPSSNINGQKP